MKINPKLQDAIEWIACIVIAVVVAYLVRYYVGTPTVVQSESMYPTLIENQRLWLNRWSRTTKKLDPKREKERRFSLLEAIKDSDLRIDTILCDTKLDLFDVLTMQVGDIIPLNMPIDSNVTVKIGDNVWFDGKLGIKNKKKAVKIDNIYKDLGK